MRHGFGSDVRMAIRVFGLRRGTLYWLMRLASKAAPSFGGRVRRLSRGAGRSPLHLRIASTDWRVLAQIHGRRDYHIRHDAYRAALDRHYRRILAAGRVPVIVDCGANVGLASLWYAEMYPEARIFAVEPEPQNFAVLQLNTADHPGVVPIHAAVSDRETRIDLLNTCSDHPWAWRTRENDTGGEVATVTVPDILRRDPLGEPLIVKIDIEGGEIDLFRSNHDWTDTVPCIVFEDHDWMLPWSGSAGAVLSVLVRRRRSYLHHGENTFAFLHDALIEPPGAEEVAEAR